MHTMITNRNMAVKTFEFLLDGKPYVVNAEVDMHKLAYQMYHKAVRNKSGKTKIGNGAITVYAREKEIE
jgi:hypothetical protein